jgi:mono/diheme cytochrome c family protein
MDPFGSIFVRQSTLAGIALATLAGSGLAAPAGTDDLALSVREIFRSNCAGCHGPQLPKPKGRFGYVLDLKRLAANPELVVPGKPDESELLQIICRNEMPPSKALPANQKDTVRAWIVAGAPPAPSETAAGADSSPGPELPAQVRRILEDAGRFHLQLLHFPIAFLIAAALAELWSAGRQQVGPSSAVRFCVLCGAASAVPAVLLGWAYAAVGHGAGTAATLALHRWIGTAAAAWAVLTAVLVERDARRGRHGSAAQLMVLLGAVLVGVAAHFGGMLVHGDLFSDW